MVPVSFPAGRSTRRTALVAAVLLLLAGCAGAPVAPAGVPPASGGIPGTGPGTSPGSGSAPPAAPAPTPSPNVAIALREQSARAAADGDVGRAVSLLERAIRIEPRRADLWLDLAELYLRSGDPAQAAQLAAKARSLAPADRDVVRRAEGVLKRAAQVRASG